MRTATSQEATFFPNHYFRRMVVNYMVNHCQLIFNNKFLALMSLYGVEERADPDRGWTPPLSFKEYLRLLLRRDFWGDKVVLYAMSCMWSMKITVLNMKTLQEYRIQHNRVLDQLMWSITSMPQMSGWVAGEVTYFAFQVWLSGWLKCSIYTVKVLIKLQFEHYFHGQVYGLMSCFSVG